MFEIFHIFFNLKELAVHITTWKNTEWNQLLQAERRIQPLEFSHWMADGLMTHLSFCPRHLSSPQGWGLPCTKSSALLLLAEYLYPIEVQLFTLNPHHENIGGRAFRKWLSLESGAFTNEISFRNKEILATAWPLSSHKNNYPRAGSEACTGTASSLVLDLWAPRTVRNETSCLSAKGLWFMAAQKHYNTRTCNIYINTRRGKYATVFTAWVPIRITWRN